MSRVKVITDETFGREVLASSLPVVVDVYADWCPPCRALSPVLERFAEAYAGRIKFVKANADEELAISQAYQINSLPTLLFFENGRLVDRLVGFPRMPMLTARLDGLGGQTQNVVGCCI